MEYEKGLVEDHVELLKLVIAQLSIREETPAQDTILAIYSEICKDRRMFWINKAKTPAKPSIAPADANVAGTQEPEALPEDADWRNEPASEAQKKTMTNCKITFTPDITKGQASDLIDAKFKKK